MGIAILKKFVEVNHWDLRIAIISTEENPVVRRRAEKMGLTYYHGVKNKFRLATSILDGEKLSDLSGMIYLGNDLNDLSLFDTIAILLPLLMPMKESRRRLYGDQCKRWLWFCKSLRGKVVKIGSYVE